MRISKAILTAVAITVMGGAAEAQSTPQAAPLRAPTPIPIEEWSQAKIIAMGQAIYRQDTAAWVATDALLAALSQDQLGTVRGWIVEPSGEDQRVRFLKAAGDDVAAGWDVLVTGNRAGAVVPATDPALTESERTQFAARQTAVADNRPLRCAPRPNAVVLRDPDSDGWLVWILTATTDSNILPMGGHYRYRISADGKTIRHRDQLSNSCLNMPKQDGPNGQPAGLVVTQIVSAGPVETHVFLSLQNRIPIYVAAGDKVFAVEGARIRDASAAMRR